MDLPNAKYHLGQNFLSDPALLDHLVTLSEVIAGERVLEVGCGRGDLTSALLRHEASVIGLEIDADLIPVLEQRFAQELKTGQLKLHHVNARDIDWGQFAVERLLSNVPYNLTRYFLRQSLVQLPQVKTMGFTLQVEAAERLLALGPQAKDYDSKLYGPLAILRHSYGTGKIVHRFRRQDFDPPPHVDSVFVVLKSHNPSSFYLKHSKAFYEIIEMAFQQRRKTLHNNWRKAWPWQRGELQHFLETEGLKGKRAEEVELGHWESLGEKIVDRFY